MGSIFPSESQSPTPKLFVTTGALPAYIDASQLPTKRTPWRQIRELSFVKSVSLSLPDVLYAKLKTWENGTGDGDGFDSSAGSKIEARNHSKVIMKLEEVVTGEFFTEYIKKGRCIP